MQIPIFSDAAPCICTKFHHKKTSCKAKRNQCANILLKNVTLLSTSGSSNDHINLKGNNVILESILTNVRYWKSPQSNIVLQVMRLISPNGKIQMTDIKFTCSLSFFADIQSMDFSFDFKVTFQQNKGLFS